VVKELVVNNGAGPERNRVVAALRELIDALDRRVPHVERLGEVRIAREAADLRKEAAKEIEELSPMELNSHTGEREGTDAVMTDDGGPPRSR
jgi:hypothetical protein